MASGIGEVCRPQRNRIADIADNRKRKQYVTTDVTRPQFIGRGVDDGELVRWNDRPTILSSRLIKFFRGQMRHDVTTLLGEWLPLGRERCIDLSWIDVVEVTTDRLECDAYDNFQHLRRGVV